MSKRRQKAKKRQLKGDTNQHGKALVRRLGADHQQILFPDGGQQPLKRKVRKHQARPINFGSHMNGRHKQG
jgi:hypothetical protein